jgi:hypothetical protein
LFFLAVALIVTSHRSYYASSWQQVVDDVPKPKRAVPSNANVNSAKLRASRDDFDIGLRSPSRVSDAGTCLVLMLLFVGGVVVLLF